MIDLTKANINTQQIFEKADSERITYNIEREISGFPMNSQSFRRLVKVSSPRCRKYVMFEDSKARALRYSFRAQT